MKGTITLVCGLVLGKVFSSYGQCTDPDSSTVGISNLEAFIFDPQGLNTITIPNLQCQENFYWNDINAEDMVFGTGRDVNFECVDDGGGGFIWQQISTTLDCLPITCQNTLVDPSFYGIKFDSCETGPCQISGSPAVAGATEDIQTYCNSVGYLVTSSVSTFTCKRDTQFAAFFGRYHFIPDWAPIPPSCTKASCSLTPSSFPPFVLTPPSGPFVTGDVINPAIQCAQYYTQDSTLYSPTTLNLLCEGTAIGSSAFVYTGSTKTIMDALSPAQIQRICLPPRFDPTDIPLASEVENLQASSVTYTPPSTTNEHPASMTINCLPGYTLTDGENPVPSESLLLETIPTSEITSGTFTAYWPHPSIDYTYPTNAPSEAKALNITCPPKICPSVTVAQGVFRDPLYPIPEFEEESETLVTLFPYPQSITLTCKSGYTLHYQGLEIDPDVQKTQVIPCLPTTIMGVNTVDWIGISDYTCEPAACPSPTTADVRDALRVTYPNAIYAGAFLTGITGDAALFRLSCDPGYSFLSSPAVEFQEFTFTCSPDDYGASSWQLTDAAVIGCAVIPCSSYAITPGANSQMIVASGTVDPCIISSVTGSTCSVTVDCVSGYTNGDVVATKSFQCLGSAYGVAQWNLLDAAYDCSAVTVPDAETVFPFSHGVIDAVYPSLTYSPSPLTTAHVSCDSGYRLMDKKSNTWLSGGGNITVTAGPRTAWFEQPYAIYDHSLVSSLNPAYAPFQVEPPADKKLLLARNLQCERALCPPFVLDPTWNVTVVYEDVDGVVLPDTSNYEGKGYLKCIEGYLFTHDSAVVSIPDTCILSSVSDVGQWNDNVFGTGIYQCEPMQCTTTFYEAPGRLNTLRYVGYPGMSAPALADRVYETGETKNYQMECTTGYFIDSALQGVVEGKIFDVLHGCVGTAFGQVQFRVVTPDYPVCQPGYCTPITTDFYNPYGIIITDRSNNGYYPSDITVSCIPGMQVYDSSLGLTTVADIYATNTPNYVRSCVEDPSYQMVWGSPTYTCLGPQDLPGDAICFVGEPCTITIQGIGIENSNVLQLVKATSTDVCKGNLETDLQYLSSPAIDSVPVSTGPTPPTSITISSVAQMTTPSLSYKKPSLSQFSICWLKSSSPGETKQRLLGTIEYAGPNTHYYKEDPSYERIYVAGSNQTISIDGHYPPGTSYTFILVDTLGLSACDGTLSVTGDEVVIVSGLTQTVTQSSKTVLDLVIRTRRYKQFALCYTACDTVVNKCYTTPKLLYPLITVQGPRTTSGTIVSYNTAHVFNYVINVNKMIATDPSPSWLLTLVNTTAYSASTCDTASPNSVLGDYVYEDPSSDFSDGTVPISLASSLTPFRSSSLRTNSNTTIDAVWKDTRVVYTGRYQICGCYTSNVQDATITNTLCNRSNAFGADFGTVVMNGPVYNPVTISCQLETDTCTTIALPGTTFDTGDYISFFNNGCYNKNSSTQLSYVVGGMDMTEFPLLSKNATHGVFSFGHPKSGLISSSIYICYASVSDISAPPPVASDFYSNTGALMNMRGAYADGNTTIIAGTVSSIKLTAASFPASTSNVLIYLRPSTQSCIDPSSPLSHIQFSQNAVGSSFSTAVVGTSITEVISGVNTKLFRYQNLSIGVVGSFVVCACPYQTSSSAECVSEASFTYKSLLINSNGVEAIENTAFVSNSIAMGYKHSLVVTGKGLNVNDRIRLVDYRQACNSTNPFVDDEYLVGTPTVTTIDVIDTDRSRATFSPVQLLWNNEAKTFSKVKMCWCSITTADCTSNSHFNVELFTITDTPHSYIFSRPAFNKYTSRIASVPTTTISISNAYCGCTDASTCPACADPTNCCTSVVNPGDGLRVVQSDQSCTSVSVTNTTTFTPTNPNNTPYYTRQSYKFTNAASYDTQVIMTGNSESITFLQGGQYKLCWCPNGMDCTQPSNYYGNLGQFYVKGPKVPIDNFVTFLSSKDLVTIQYTDNDSIADPIMFSSNYDGNTGYSKCGDVTTSINSNEVLRISTSDSNLAAPAVYTPTPLYTKTVNGDGSTSYTLSLLFATSKVFDICWGPNTSTVASVVVKRIVVYGPVVPASPVPILVNGGDVINIPITLLGIRPLATDRIMLVDNNSVCGISSGISNSYEYIKNTPTYSVNPSTSLIEGNDSFEMKLRSGGTSVKICWCNSIVGCTTAAPYMYHTQISIYDIKSVIYTPQVDPTVIGAGLLKNITIQGMGLTSNTRVILANSTTCISLDGTSHQYYGLHRATKTFIHTLPPTAVTTISGTVGSDYAITRLDWHNITVTSSGVYSLCVCENLSNTGCVLSTDFRSTASSIQFSGQKYTEITVANGIFKYEYAPGLNEHYTEADRPLLTSDTYFMVKRGLFDAHTYSYCDVSLSKIDNTNDINVSIITPAMHSTSTGTLIVTTLSIGQYDICYCKSDEMNYGTCSSASGILVLKKIRVSGIDTPKTYPSLTPSSDSTPAGVSISYYVNGGDLNVTSISNNYVLHTYYRGDGSGSAGNDIPSAWANSTACADMLLTSNRNGFNSNAATIANNLIPLTYDTDVNNNGRLASYTKYEYKSTVFKKQGYYTLCGLFTPPTTIGGILAPSTKALSILTIDHIYIYAPVITPISTSPIYANIKAFTVEVINGNIGDRIAVHNGTSCDNISNSIFATVSLPAVSTNGVSYNVTIEENSSTSFFNICWCSYKSGTNICEMYQDIYYAKLSGIRVTGPYNSPTIPLVYSATGRSFSVSVKGYGLTLEDKYFILAPDSVDADVNSNITSCNRISTSSIRSATLLTAPAISSYTSVTSTTTTITTVDITTGDTTTTTTPTTSPTDVTPYQVVVLSNILTTHSGRYTVCWCSSSNNCKLPNSYAPLQNTYPVRGYYYEGAVSNITSAVTVPTYTLPYWPVEMINSGMRIKTLFISTLINTSCGYTPTIVQHPYFFYGDSIDTLQQKISFVPTFSGTWIMCVLDNYTSTTDVSAISHKEYINYAGTVYIHGTSLQVHRSLPNSIINIDTSKWASDYNMTLKNAPNNFYIWKYNTGFETNNNGYPCRLTSDGLTDNAQLNNWSASYLIANATTSLPVTATSNSQVAALCYCTVITSKGNDNCVPINMFYVGGVINSGVYTNVYTTTQSFNIQITGTLLTSSMLLVITSDSVCTKTSSSPLVVRQPNPVPHVYDSTSIEFQNVKVEYGGVYSVCISHGMSDDTSTGYSWMGGVINVIGPSLDVTYDGVRNRFFSIPIDGYQLKATDTISFVREQGNCSTDVPIEYASDLVTKTLTVDPGTGRSTLTFNNILLGNAETYKVCWQFYNTDTDDYSVSTQIGILTVNNYRKYNSNTINNVDLPMSNPIPIMDSLVASVSGIYSLSWVISDDSTDTIVPDSLRKDEKMFMYSLVDDSILPDNSLENDINDLLKSSLNVTNVSTEILQIKSISSLNNKYDNITYLTALVTHKTLDVSDTVISNRALHCLYSVVKDDGTGSNTSTMKVTNGYIIRLIEYQVLLPVLPLEIASETHSHLLITTPDIPSRATLTKNSPSTNTITTDITSTLKSAVENIDHDLVYYKDDPTYNIGSLHQKEMIFQCFFTIQGFAYEVLYRYEINYNGIALSTSYLGGNSVQFPFPASITQRPYSIYPYRNMIYVSVPLDHRVVALKVNNIFTMADMVLHNDLSFGTSSIAKVGATGLTYPLTLSFTTLSEKTLLIVGEFDSNRIVFLRVDASTMGLSYYQSYGVPSSTASRGITVFPKGTVFQRRRLSEEQSSLTLQEETKEDDDIYTVRRLATADYPTEEEDTLAGWLLFLHEKQGYGVEYLSTVVDLENAVSTVNFTFPLETSLFMPFSPITPVSPIILNNSLIDSFSITPPLNNGLDFNTTSGQLSGTPDQASLPLTYTIKGVNLVSSKSVDITFAISCEAGSIWSDDTSLCEKCPIGFYRESNTAETCISCPSNESTLSIGSTLSSDCLCDPGYTRNSVSGQCDQCAPGQYKTILGNSTCIGLCFSNSISTHTGATTIAEALDYCYCLPGYYSNAQYSCAVCPIGSYCEGLSPGSTFVQCPHTFTTATSGIASQNDCMCDAGYSYNTPDNTCTGCGITTYKPSPGNITCNYLCPAHSYFPGIDNIINYNITPVVIDDNTADRGAISDLECSYCTPGYYRVDNHCEICPLNHYCPGEMETKISCPINEVTRAIGSDNIYQCLCTSGYEWIKTAVTSANPRGGVCQTCSAGTFKDNIGPGNCYSCPSGLINNNSGESSYNSCFCREGEYWDSMATADALLVSSITVNNTNYMTDTTLTTPKYRDIYGDIMGVSCSVCTTTNSTGNSTLVSTTTLSYHDCKASLLPYPEGAYVVFNNANYDPAHSSPLHLNDPPLDTDTGDCLLYVIYDGTGLTPPGYTNTTATFISNHDTCAYNTCRKFASSAQECSYCPLNYYCRGGKINNFHVPSTKCYDNSITLQYSSPSIDYCYCTPGYHRSENSCSLCPSNFYSDTPTRALSCNACRENGISLPGAKWGSDCYCKDGYYIDNWVIDIANKTAQQELYDSLDSTYRFLYFDLNNYLWVNTGESYNSTTLHCNLCPDNLFCKTTTESSTGEVIRYDHNPPATCGVGSSVPTTALTRIKRNCSCTPGFGSVANGCEPCPRTMLKDNILNSDCRDRCYTNAVSNIGSMKKTQCYCPESYYLKLTGISEDECHSNFEDPASSHLTSWPDYSLCTACVEGMVCPGGFSEDTDIRDYDHIYKTNINLPLVTKGYYMKKECVDINVTKCYLSDACLGSTLEGVNVCAPGMTGLLCNNCSKGYMKIGNRSTCVECPSLPISMVLLLLIIFAVLLAIIAVTMLSVYAINHSDSIFIVVFRIALVYFSCVSAFLLLDVTKIYVPSILIDLWEYVSLIGSGDALSLFTTQCLFLSSSSSLSPQDAFFYTQSFFYLLPYIIILLATVFGVLSIIIMRAYTLQYRISNTKTLTQLANAGIIQQPLYDRAYQAYINKTVFFIWRFIYRPYDSLFSIIGKFITDSIPLYIVGIVLLYNTITKQMIRLIQCELIFNESRLRYNLEVSCDSDAYYTWNKLGYLGIIQWSLLVPIILFIRLFAAQRKLHEKSVQTLFSVLYNGYEPQTCYWECLLLFKRLIFFLCVSANFGEKSGGIRLTFLILFSALFMMIHFFTSPYDKRGNNVLNTLETRSLLVTTFSFVLFQISYSFDAGEGFNRVIGYLIVISHYLLIVNFVVSFVYEIGVSLRSVDSVTRIPILGGLFRSLSALTNYYERKSAYLYFNTQKMCLEMKTPDYLLEKHLLDIKKANVPYGEEKKGETPEEGREEKREEKGEKTAVDLSKTHTLESQLEILKPFTTKDRNYLILSLREILLHGIVTLRMNCLSSDFIEFAVRWIIVNANMSSVRKKKYGQAGDVSLMINTSVNDDLIQYASEMESVMDREKKNQERRKKRISNYSNTLLQHMENNTFGEKGGEDESDMEYLDQVTSKLTDIMENNNPITSSDIDVINAAFHSASSSLKERNMGIIEDGEESQGEDRRGRFAAENFHGMPQSRSSVNEGVENEDRALSFVSDEDDMERGEERRGDGEEDFDVDEKIERDDENYGEGDQGEESAISSENDEEYESEFDEKEFENRRKERAKKIKEKMLLEKKKLLLEKKKQKQKKSYFKKNEEAAKQSQTEKLLKGGELGEIGELGDMSVKKNHLLLNNGKQRILDTNEIKNKIQTGNVIQKVEFSRLIIQSENDRKLFELSSLVEKLFDDDYFSMGISMNRFYQGIVAFRKISPMELDRLYRLFHFYKSSLRNKEEKTIRKKIEKITAQLEKFKFAMEGTEGDEEGGEERKEERRGEERSVSEMVNQYATEIEEEEQQNAAVNPMIYYQLKEEYNRLHKELLTRKTLLKNTIDERNRLAEENATIRMKLALKYPQYAKEITGNVLSLEEIFGYDMPRPGRREEVEVGRERGDVSSEEELQGDESISVSESMGEGDTRRYSEALEDFREHMGREYSVDEGGLLRSIRRSEGSMVGGEGHVEMLDEDGGEREEWERREQREEGEISVSEEDEGPTRPHFEDPDVEEMEFGGDQEPSEYSRDQEHPPRNSIFENIMNNRR